MWKRPNIRSTFPVIFYFFSPIIQSILITFLLITLPFSFYFFSILQQETSTGVSILLFSSIEQENFFFFTKQETLTGVSIFHLLGDLLVHNFLLFLFYFSFWFGFLCVDHNSRSCQYKVNDVGLTIDIMISSTNHGGSIRNIIDLNTSISSVNDFFWD